MHGRPGSADPSWSEEARRSNDRIAERAIRLHFVSRVPMLCECGDPGCQTIVLIALDRYRELRGDGFFTVTGIDRVGRIRHPQLTVTVLDVDGLVEALAARDLERKR